MQAYDPLKMGLNFRGLQISSVLVGVSVGSTQLGPSDSPWINLKEDSEILVSFFDPCAQGFKLPHGAYTVGVNLETSGEPLPGRVSITQDQLVNGAIVRNAVTTCPLVRGPQTCMGWVNTVTSTTDGSFHIKIEMTGALQPGVAYGTPSLKKILADVPN